MDVVGTLMGGETTLCSGSNYPVDLTVSGTATPSLAEIVRDGVVIASRANCTSPNCDLSTTVFATPGFINLYGRVTHDPSTGCVNCKTWSSPVKVNTSTEPSCISTGVPSIGGAGTAILIAALALAAAFALRSIRPA